MGKLATLIFGIMIGVIGTIALLKFPSLTKQTAISVWNFLKTIIEYFKTRIT